MVEPVPMKNPGVYVARVVSDVFEKIHQSFHRLSDAHRRSLGEVQGEPERKQEVQVVTTSGSQGDRENCEKKVPFYGMVEMINTSAGTIEIGKNVKIGEGEHLELSEAEIIT
jgi:sugar-specific transcriptional regulator TrmB